MNYGTAERRRRLYGERQSLVHELNACWAIMSRDASDAGRSDTVNMTGKWTQTM